MEVVGAPIPESRGESVNKKLTRLEEKRFLLPGKLILPNQILKKKRMPLKRFYLFLAGQFLRTQVH